MHTSFLTTATQIQLVNYVTNTGCVFECQDPRIDRWVPFGHPSLIGRHIIRLKLTEYSLPSHLPPHNPANVHAEVITEGGYRAWTVMEYENPSIRTSDRMSIEVWEGSRWDDTGWEGSLGHLTYRVPVSVPFPDWEEMSKAKPSSLSPTGHTKMTTSEIKEVLETMQNSSAKPTFVKVQGPSGRWTGNLLTPQHTFPMPQPITDPMPPLAEGCQRYYTRWYETWECIGAAQFDNDTHFLDLRNLPSPEEANRTAFEKAWLKKESNLAEKETAWHFWNAALESLND